jgi:hypothetical protein
MAKLKVFDANGVVAVQGYVNVVNALVSQPNPNVEQTNLRKFLDADPEDRPEMLQKFADDPTNTTGRPIFHVEHEKEGGGSVSINNDNCRIFAQRDQRQKGNKNRSRVTMPIPVEGIQDFSYLDDYIKTIVLLWNGAPAGPGGVPPAIQPNPEMCRRFMFGMMMLTRCR